VRQAAPAVDAGGGANGVGEFQVSVIVTCGDPLPDAISRRDEVSPRAGTGGTATDRTKPPLA
jgi:hypothetical protein